MSLSFSTTLKPSGGDDAPQLQAALNAGPGRVQLCAGEYKLISAGLIIPSSVTLEGANQNAVVIDGAGLPNATNAITFASNACDSWLRDLTVYGLRNATGNTIFIPAGVVGGGLRDVTAWFGAAALFTQATDQDYDNCYIGNSYGLGAVVSNGANWYRRCKVDSSDAVRPTPANQFGFYQGDYANGGMAENHFSLCDFSGDYATSAAIEDAPAQQAVTCFSGCVFSSGITAGNHKFTVLIGCEVAGAMQGGNAPLRIAGASYAVGSVTLGGNVSVSADCVGI